MGDLFRKTVEWARLLARVSLRRPGSRMELVQALPAALWRGLLRFPAEATVRRQLRRLCASTDGRPVIVMPAPSVPWSFMVQRPQQLAAAFARAGAVVLYGTQNYHVPAERRVRGLKRVAERLYLFNDGRDGRTLEAVRRGIVWQYWAFQGAFTAAMPPDTVRVYDWLDETDVHAYGPRDLQRHRRLLEAADLVVTTARQLHRQARAVRDDALLVPNGAEFPFFAHPRPAPWPELDALVDRGRPIVGYYGALAEHVDFDLVAACARRHPEWTFLLVGPVLGRIPWKASGCASLANVVRWGHQPYGRLPHLLSRFTVATIPFRVNTVTRAVSPVKLFEYMAGGKPVVTTDLPECRGRTGVLVAADADRFDVKLAEAMRLAEDPRCRAELTAQGRANSWDARARQVLDELKRRGLIEWQAAGPQEAPSAPAVIPAPSR